MNCQSTWAGRGATPLSTAADLGWLTALLWLAAVLMPAPVAHARGADLPADAVAGQTLPGVSVQVAYNENYTGVVEAGLSVRVHDAVNGQLAIEAGAPGSDGTPQGWTVSGEGIDPGGGCQAVEPTRMACDAARSLNVDLGPGATMQLRTPLAVSLRRVSIVSDDGASDVTVSGPFRFEFLRMKLLAGDNRLTVEGLAEQPDSWVLMGNGSDTVNASNLDTVTLAGGRDACTCSSINKLSLGSGDDTLIGGQFGIARLADGNDRALITATATVPAAGPDVGARARSRIGVANTITGGQGDDLLSVDPRAKASGYRLVGMRGNDRFSTKGGGAQRIEGGSGRDVARIDRRDKVSGVDRVRRR